MLVLSLICIGLLLVAVVLSCDGRRRGQSRSVSQGRVLVGVLGDSDSAAYQDKVTFPDGGPVPGGSYHSITFQWPEVLARIRSSQVDLGEWSVWGVPRWLSWSRVRDGLGLPWRAPQRETYQHNLAWPSGCESLTEGALRQTQRLVDVMDEKPEDWRRGVVVIRSGINDIGKEQALGVLAKQPDDPEIVSLINSCVDHIRVSVELIHARHPETSVVLVGILNNSDWPPYFSRWQSAEAQRNINRGLDHFDDALRALASRDSRLAFFNDRAWFAQIWGQRNLTTGMPSYQSVKISESLTVSNSSGDSPDHAVLANLHAGLVWNILWVQAIAEFVQTQFELPIDRVTDVEVRQFIQSQVDTLPSIQQPSDG